MQFTIVLISSRTEVGHSMFMNLQPTQLSLTTLHIAAATSFINSFVTDDLQEGFLVHHLLAYTTGGLVAELTTWASSPCSLAVTVSLKPDTYCNITLFHLLREGSLQSAQP